MEDSPKASVFCATTGRDRRNMRRVALWSALWGASFIGATAAIRFEWLASSTAEVLAVLLSIALAVRMAFVYWRYLREADELQRRIELEALALAFGIGVVGGLAYWLLGLSGVLEEAEIPWLVSGMLVSYSLAVIWGKRRYA